ncbi:Type-1 restriction enzyme MjaXIP specificity protein [uncultured archaeon]|nr:Type-1 restriction enzyme MjaXIP specificity protein [uncultured archaeon]
MEDWVKMKIENVVLKTKLKDPNKNPDITFKYVDVSGVSNTLFKIDNYAILFGKEAPSRARKLINFQDIIFATVRPTLMRIALVPQELDSEVCSTGYCVLKPNQEKIVPQFLYYSVLTDSFIEKISQLQKGASYPAIRDSDLKNQILYLPPLPEQRKIAHVLSTVLKAIEHQDNLIRTTTELKKALMQKLFKEGTRGEPKKETEIGLVPESWEVVRIGDMYEFTSKPRGLDIGSPIPFIPMDMVPLNELEINKYVLRDQVSSGTYVENGDLLLAKITPSFENGKQGFVSIDKPFAYATTEVIPIKEKEGLSHKFYLYYFLLKDDIRSQLTGKMEGSTGRQRLSKTVLEETLIPKPSLAEQIEIAKLYISFDKKISVCNSKKQTLTALFKTLLHELMTGQRRVHEVEFEVRKTLV